jgi:4-amino-4-deoxy-L-arabinose transferase-like glycosyltransferase
VGPRTWRWLIGVQLVALLFCGAMTVARFHVWAEIDERAHYAYVQEVAENGRLPRIDDVVSWQVQAITDNTWPHRSDREPAQAGLAGRNYEAFQPPLYYLASVPAFAVGGDHRHKVFALRIFDLVLLAVAAALLFVLAREVVPDAPLVGYAAALGVLLWPGVVARSVTVSNLPLELVLVTALMVALTRALRRREARWVVAAGALFGLCLLTKLTLVYLVVPFAIVLARRLRAAPRATLAAAALPAVILSPWLISNLVRLGTLTANNAARRQQTPFLYPGGNDFGLDDVPSRLWHIPDGVLAQEWARQLDVGWVQAAVLVLFVALLAAALASAATRRAQHLLLPGSALLAAVVIAIATALTAHWDLFLLRYYYAILPPLAIGIAAHLHRAGRDTLVAAMLGAETLLLGALWIDIAGAFYFTGLGDRLGI